MSIARAGIDWLKPLARRGFQGSGERELLASHSPVILPDGQLMYVRNASLAAAKDLLARQRAIERHQRGL
ncbi:MAG TPA: hypothetical protein VF812_07860 [Ktedonobacterales bacterium]